MHPLANVDASPATDRIACPAQGAARCSAFLRASRAHLTYLQKKKAAPSVTSDFFETRGSHQSRGLTDGGLQRVRNFVSLFGSWDLLKFRWLNFSLLSCDDHYIYILY